MTHHCYLVGVQRDGESEFKDAYLVIAPNKNEAKELVQSKLKTGEKAQAFAQWRDNVVRERIWRDFGGGQRVSFVI